MSSLNEGFELDDELEHTQNKPQADSDEVSVVQLQDLSEKIFKDINPGEVPELNAEVAVLSVVDAVKDLDYLRQDIERSSGVNKTFALEAEKLIPGFINNDRPLAFFTEFASKTNYAVTLEAIEEQTQSILKKIWNAIVEFVKQAVQWLSGVAEKLFENKEKAQQCSDFYEKTAAMASELDRVQAAFQNPRSVVDKVTRLVQDKHSDAFKAYVGSLEQKLESGNTRMRSLYSSIAKNNTAYAVVIQNTAVKSILEIAERCGEIVEGFSTIDQEMLDDLFKVNVDADLTKRSANAAIAKILAVAGKRNLNSFHSHAKQIEFSLQQRSVEYLPKNMPLSKILVIYNNTFKDHDMITIGKSLIKAQERLKELQKVMYGFSSKPSWNAKERRAANLTFINEVFRTIHLELSGVMTMLKHATNLYASWMWIGESLQEIAQDYKRRVMSQTADLDEKSKQLIFDYFGIENKI